MSIQDYHLGRGRPTTDIIPTLQGIFGLPTLTESGRDTDLSFEKGCLSLRKAEQGEYYLMATFSNRFRDIDRYAAPHKGGEIVASYAHEKYMKFLDANPDLAPELWSLHIPGTERKNRAHWWDYDGAFCYAEFKLTAAEAAGVAEFCKTYTPGLSHGFYVLKYDKEEAVIEEYYTYEISILPIEWAANPWTTFELIEKELSMKLTAERRAALVAMHGEKFVAQLELKGDQMLAMLEEIKADTKALADAQEKSASAEGGNAQAATPAGTEATSSEEGALEAPVTAKEVLAALKALNDKFDADLTKITDALSAKFEDLELRLEAVEVSDDQRLAAKAAATPASLLASFMPQSVIGRKETEVKGKVSKGPEENTSGFAHAFAQMFEEGLKNG